MYEEKKKTKNFAILSVVSSYLVIDCQSLVVGYRLSAVDRRSLVDW